jgi:NAD(P)-dependent dehydrogenase (short-subunit alcohol dehydrogenase family)
LVNNAAIIRDEMMGRTKFWDEPINVIDTLDVGLCSSYIATVYAAPLMITQRHGLVAFSSSSGAVHYAFGPVGAELAVKYGITDEDGRQPPSYRDMFDVHPGQQYPHEMR